MDGTSMRRHAHEGEIFWLLYVLGLCAVGVTIIIAAAAIV
jgi:hypothetical protein